MRLSKYAIVVGCALFASSCAHFRKSHARVVKTLPGKGGEITINQGFDNGANARVEAESFMTSNCGAGQFHIVEEGEVVTGQTTEIIGSTSITTKNTTEWRIKYECGKKNTAQS